jgi:hypothetical protein
MAKAYVLPRQSSPYPRHGEGGFILLEVLVAMSLVASTWIAVIDSYSKLVLYLGLLEKKRASIYRELDEYEIHFSRNQVINKVVISHTKKDQDRIHEASRMPRRSGALPHASRRTINK